MTEWDIKGKVCLVTGANSGLGRETCLELIKRGAARVILACRDMESGEQTIKYIRENAPEVDTEEGRLALRQLDLASFDSIRKLAAQVNEEEKELHVLINNAGVYAPREKSFTKDGFELTFGTNHLGHFLLTKLLLDLLKKSAPARIVVVASDAYKSCWLWGGFRIDDPNFETGGYGAGAAYCQSKLANVLFARELDKKLNANGPSGVTVYSLHPGTIMTNLWRHRHWILQYIAIPFSWLFLSTVKQGIMTIIHCATKPGIENHSGRYFSNCDFVETWAVAQDDAVAGKLWDLSERLTSK